MKCKYTIIISALLIGMLTYFHIRLLFEISIVSGRIEAIQDVGLRAVGSFDSAELNQFERYVVSYYPSTESRVQNRPLRQLLTASRSNVTQQIQVRLQQLRKQDEVGVEPLNRTLHFEVNGARLPAPGETYIRRNSVRGGLEVGSDGSP